MVRLSVPAEPVAPPASESAGVGPRRLRIGLFRRYLSPEPGGVQRSFWEFSSRLAARGHEVHVFTQIAGTPPEGAVLHVVPRLEDPEVVKLVTDLRPDVLSADPERIRPTAGLRFNVLRPGFGAAGVIANGTLSRSPVLRGLYRVCRMIVPRGWRVGRERWWFSQTDPAPLVVANSEMVRRNLRTQYGIPDERIHLVYNGVDVEHFNPARCAELRAEARRQRGLSDGTIVFLFVGHNFARKGAWELIRAAGRLARRRNDIRVIVCGDGTTRLQRAEARLRRWWAGARACVALPGRERDMLRAYAAADAVVLPSWHDSFAFVVLEAAACGLPLITTRQTGAAELITDGVDGFVLNRPDDLTALADRMERLCDPTVRAAMGRAARTLAERHTLAVSYRRLTEVFERAAVEAPLTVAGSV